MEKWQVQLRLKFKGIPWRIPIGFSYEWKAWLLAYDHFNVGPEEFGKIEADKQINAMAYGAAVWHRIKQRKKVFFTYDDLMKALMKASKEDNQKLLDTMAYSIFPDWLKKGTLETDKKKEET